MKRNEEFLALYKELESAIESVCHPRATDSPIFVYENVLKKSDQLEKKNRGESYGVIRQLRNILAHEDIHHEAPFIVSDETIRFMTEEIERLAKQPCAIDVCVPREKLLFATKYSKIKDVVSNMLSRGITNVPILSEEQLKGMFSGKSLLHMLENSTSISITSTTKIMDILDYVKLDMEDGIRYEFVSSDTKLDMLEEIFRRNSKGKTELVIVTAKGGKYEPVLGVISPHDVLEKR